MSPGFSSPAFSSAVVSSAVFSAAALAVAALLWFWAPTLLSLVGLGEFGEIGQVGLVILGMTAAEALWSRFGPATVTDAGTGAGTSHPP